MLTIGSGLPQPKALGVHVVRCERQLKSMSRNLKAESQTCSDLQTVPEPKANSTHVVVILTLVVYTVEQPGLMQNYNDVCSICKLWLGRAL